MYLLLNSVSKQVLTHIIDLNIKFIGLYYTVDQKGEYTVCFDQKEINKAQLIKLFMNIDKVIGSERKKLDEKNKWSVLTMTVTNDGKMKNEFDYSDISENSFEYEQKWKDKYIK